jgi:pimeloyl-ACP methyl ester carboxylesterase
MSVKRFRWAAVLALFVSLLLIVSTFVQPTLAGSLKKPGHGGVPGEWYVGEMPPNADPGLPVLLFVHGLNGSASIWYEGNNMYETAYHQGYQTVFVDLYDAGGNPKSMWDNGEMLAQIIEEVYDHFGRDIVLVSYSKGGIDSQAALIHYDAHPYVSNVITLGTPHRGSQLADLAYSGAAWWLAAIIGQRNDATYSLQTGYMSYFRSLTDSHANVSRNQYYTLAGTHRGSFGSALWWGGLYLSAYGSNDGAVVASYASLPYGQVVRVDSGWNHDTIKTGRTFNWFRPFLTTRTGSTSETEHQAETPHDRAGQVALREAYANQYIHGDVHSGLISEPILIEDRVQSVTISVFTDQPLDQLRLYDPAGQEEHQIRVQVEKDEHIFQGAYQYLLTVDQPRAGEWTLKGDTSGASGAFLLAAHFDSPLTNDLKLQLDAQQLQLYVDASFVSRAQANYSIDFFPDRLQSKRSGSSTGVKLIEREAVQGSNIALPVVTEPGVYNITVELSGETAAGHSLRRTAVHSVYVDEHGKLY